ncbi:hypothetical protein B5G34_12395 [Flavonifractor sp. An82]|uniref:hypothetical protein n=1 Tax=Flavonifractor sp. An82 TaxID=1965660 RepID=UPI000B3891DF|nr:hypothetical protein [Flavonifractor sp. An82]OUN21144.1 hypothetical protein B5G34_12395 [Flavonifractor sp. An82]
MKRRDTRSRYVIIWLAVMLSAGLAGWLLRGPVSTALAGWDAARVCTRIGLFCFLLADVLLASGAVWWAVAHHLRQGAKYALRHWQLLHSIKRAMLEAGYGIPIGEQYYRLPRVKIRFDDRTLTAGLVEVQNHIKSDSSLAAVNLSSALGVYVVDAQYISDDNNYYCYEISDSRIDRQLQFDSYTALSDYARKHTGKYGPYTLFADGRNEGIKIRSLLLVGITGAGKSYALMGLIAQLQNWPIPPVVYYADPKGSDIAVLGGSLVPERTADDIDGIIDLLHAFYAAMMERKEEMRGKLSGKLGADYTEFQLPAYVFLFDEFAAFQASISRDKKRRDEVEELMRNVVLIGRQLGFFAWISMQKSDSGDIPTAIRDNLPLKICLGNAPSTTMMTIFGHTSDLPSRHWGKGRGLIYCDGITAAPRPVSFPTLNFDIFAELTKPKQDSQSEGVNRA